MAVPLRPSVRVGEWVAVSGSLGLVDGVLADGFAAQARAGLANFTAELARQGLAPGDVVKTTVFLVDESTYSAMNAAYAEVFMQEPPARSAVFVRALPLGALFEIEGWAHGPADTVR